MDRILFLSNGYGEDLIASSIIKEMGRKDIIAFSLIGDGTVYKGLNIPIIKSERSLPSGGFTFQKIGAFFKDIKAGLLRQVYNQIKRLRGLRNEVKLVVCVGDIYLVILATLFVRRPIIFVATAKSDYMNRHYGIEKWLMKKVCKVVINRDEHTASSLRREGINALYLGNPIMDCLKVTNSLRLRGKSWRGKIVGILPGSREEGYSNLLDIIEICDEIKRGSKEDITFLASLTLDIERVKKSVEDIGYVFRYIEGNGVRGEVITRNGAKILLAYNHFGDVLNHSYVVIGLAGTANEQAVGSGVPVITFRGNGPQTTRKRLLGQKRLLGESLVFTDRRNVANEVLRILDDGDMRDRLSELGKIRMGCKGGSQRIAEVIVTTSNGR
ncbi:MAG: lipid-A-disaccharide synthase-related protein [bacterium]|nr:lipid-A-disaccharide synthase-related protein [bacterium]